MGKEWEVDLGRMGRGNEQNQNASYESLQGAMQKLSKWGYEVGREEDGEEWKGGSGGWTSSTYIVSMYETIKEHLKRHSSKTV